MRASPRNILSAALAATLLVTGLVGCSSSKTATPNGAGTPSASAKPANNKVGILLPDTVSSPRWVSADPNELSAQCIKYNLTCYVDNANGNAQTMQQQAQALINAGVGVLLVTDLDPGSGKAIEDLAAQHNVVSIDYDRLTSGSSNNAYYVSFDNEKVGEDQGTALTQCPQVQGKAAVNYVNIDGAPTDNNATLFANGYNKILGAAPGWKKLDAQTGKWDPQVAQTVFTSMLGAHPDLNAVMVANDTMAQSVINVLRSQHLNGKVAVSGQDATPGGLDNIMSGDQCFTIYKPASAEADVAIKLASQILAGEKPVAPATVTDPVTKREVPSYLATPTIITKANVALPVTDGYVTFGAVCSTPALVTLCNQNGIKSG